ncbi:MAG: type ISP restriction/modification enzyme [Chloroflexota bacterium]
MKTIHQLRPLHNNQPWGIFFVEFEKKRMPVVVLRRILSHLVIKKRAAANKEKAATWDQHDLLFISAFGAEDSEQREIAFAHFHQESGDLPTLKVLGWDGADTPLKLEYVADTLKEKLRWPDDAEDMEAWREEWSGAFQHKIGHVISTANALAERLAILARGICAAARTLMEHESQDGALRRLHKAFQTALIHDLTEADFADTYAQTITYGLLTAAISRTEMSAGRYGTALVAGNVTDMVPITNPFLREMLETFLQAGGRKGGIDFDELGIQDVVDLLRGDETDLPAVLRDFGNRAPGEDPVIHFYEHFLSAYNKQLKIQRGVFYTPKPVVSYIVRSVHELLQSEFGIEDGLASTITWGEMAEKHPDLKIPEGTSPASPFVQILDPATGTATFLVEVIEVIQRTLQAKWEKQHLSPAQQHKQWNEYVPQHLLPRLHGYELMMAPYAIAHMKIGLKLHETGYRFESNERVRVYLTNALEPASDNDQQLTLVGWAPALAHEGQAVNSIKRQQHFTVVIGNPPYSGHSANASKNPDGTPNFIGKLLLDYYQVDGQPLGERNPKWLQDDYVKFIRYGQYLTEKSEFSILAMITNHGYLDNPTFRGMRQRLMKTFSEIFVLDLHGNTKKKEVAPDGSKDENVFDIQQGVAIGIFVKCHDYNFSSKNSKIQNSVHHADLWTTRLNKYHNLLLGNMQDRNWISLSPQKQFYLFEPQNLDLYNEYDLGWKITDIFPINSVGIVTGQDANTIGYLRSDGINLACKNKLSDKVVTPILYRPFDNRWIVYDDSVVTRPRYEVMRHMLISNNIGLITVRQVAEGIFDHIFVARDIVESRITISNKGIGFIFPLYLSLSNEENQGQMLFRENYKQNVEIDDRVLNISRAFIADIENHMGMKFIKISNLIENFTPEHFFSYMYAIFHSPIYRKRYSEFLNRTYADIELD